MQVQLLYEAKQITQYVKPNLLRLTYTDYLSDQSDELQVEFEDIERKWVGSWFPTQGDKLSLQLGYKGEPLVNLGSFELDEIEWQWSPDRGSAVSLKALSTGVTKANRTLKPKSYENTTLVNIVKTVAKRLKLKVTGTVADIPIQRATQYQERDVEFLTRLAHEYHHSFKIVNQTLVFTTMASLETRQPVAVIDYSEVKSLRLRDRIKDTVSKVEVSGFNQHEKKALKSTKKHKAKRPTKKQAVASSADTLKIVTRGESQAQMNARADATLGENDDQQAGNITVIGNPKLVAGNTIRMTNVGMFSGKYLIKQARHTVDKRQGYTTDLEIKMIEFNEELPKDEKTTSHA
ncbi:phage late control gene D protein (GPD) [Actinobacillus ureae ATCC 25976]|uniref:Phage late control gene D protein (GPD) n=1 Tax=Actinobacillus ureae ATCC 25976 TaxID=887324 RepID=E8KKS2_9PAST|nr:contractile injection system protein, VgrG/Pvc8 family [Actinobacillus ureae]EFX90505.1 phage late control gene D protein (GPD) [Actinobacillus ureae ATCC 25976]